MRSLFDNIMVKNAKEQMTPEQQEDLKKKGEYIHEIDFITNNVKENLKSMDRVILEDAIKSLKLGCGIESLTVIEIKLLEQEFGSEWYNNFNYRIDNK